MSTGRKESILDLKLLVDKKVRVKLAGGREGALSCHICSTTSMRGCIAGRSPAAACISNGLQGMLCMSSPGSSCDGALALKHAVAV